jgi:hypothetical protein
MRIRSLRRRWGGTSNLVKNDPKSILPIQICWPLQRALWPQALGQHSFAAAMGKGRDCCCAQSFLAKEIAQDTLHSSGEVFIRKLGTVCLHHSHDDGEVA